MNKNEVLAKSRNENKNGDERDLKNRDKSYAISAGIATPVCIIMATIEELLFQRSATDIWIIYVAIEFALALSGAILSKKKWLVGLSVFMGVVLVALIYFYVRENIGSYKMLI